MTMLWNWIGAHQFAVTKISLEGVIALSLRALWRSYRSSAVTRGIEPTISGFLGLDEERV